MASENIEFKIYFRKNDKKSEIRRFSVNRDFLNNFEYLKMKIKKVFPKLKNKSFSVLWNDNEDEISISSDEELILALSCMQENIKKLYIELKHFDQFDSSKLEFLRTQPKAKAGPLMNCNVRNSYPLPESQKDNDLLKSSKKNISDRMTLPDSYHVKLITFNEEKKNSLSTDSSESCNLNEKSLQNDPTESLRLESCQSGKQNDLTETDANCDKLTELSKVVNELADLTRTLNLQCLNISHLEQANGLDNFIDHPQISEETNPLDTNIQILHKVTQDMIQLKNRFSSMNVIWENKNPIYAQSDVCELLANSLNGSKHSGVESNEMPLFDLDGATHECDNCSSVKTISESSESMEERWTLLNNEDLDVEPAEAEAENHGHSLEFQTSAVQVPDTLSEISVDPKHSDLISEPLDSTSPMEVDHHAVAVPENPPTNLETRAIFPHIAAALDILGHMGFDLEDEKLLQLTELYDGNVEAVLDTLLFVD